MIFFVIIAVAVILLFAAFFLFFESKKDITEKALALAAIGNFLDARAMVRDHLESSPGSVKSLYVMAKIYSMEGDYLSEASYLEKIKKIGRYEKEFPEITICNRIADIYYNLDMFEEAFFYYLDSLQADPTDPEALIRLGFMALGQKDFQIADVFLKKLNSSSTQIPSYFIAKGIIKANQGREGVFQDFERAYQLDRTSTVSGFLFAVSAAKEGKNDTAIEVANKVVENIEDEFIRYTLFQFIMTQFFLKEDYSSAAKHARLCVEIAKLNGWKHETTDSNFYLAMSLIAQNKMDEASDPLIDAESDRMDDTEIIELANYKYKVENGDINLWEFGTDGYDLKKEIQGAFDKNFSNERYYELSGLRSQDTFNIRGIVNEEGKKITNQIGLIGVDKLTRFNSLKGTAFKNTCVRIIMALNYRVSREIPYLENDGANYIGSNISDRDLKALFRIRKWRNVKISDVFLRDLLSAVNDLSVEKGFIIGSAELTPGAKKVFSSNPDQIVIVNGKELDDILEKALR
ncbi:MAG: restriction endonuclease [Leptospiraceae bacterium]|nr:restriction endonuclease [Leptospiraceae bacterium]MCK6381279.1 restriction endonuclease [Leptospiraceae bacterium]NUM40408.1 restriction endonuclease [Leptospiraceae bacterium]